MAEKLLNKYRIESTRMQNWQPRFYDHLIRDINEYFKIKNNPVNWNGNEFH